MDIYLTDLETGDRMRFSMLPEKITARTGTLFQDYTILSNGEIKLPQGENLTGFTWEGILPGKARENAPFVREWRNPHEIQALWSVYRVKKKKLRLLVTETPINHDVYIESYDVDYKGGHGDYFYNISFVNAKDLKVQISAAAPKPASTSSPAAAPISAAYRPVLEMSAHVAPRPSPPTPNTHTIVSGDTLWGIAQKYYGKGSDYGKIYDANRDAIEARAKKAGRSSSNNGHWIYPGTVLTIP